MSAVLSFLLNTVLIGTSIFVVLVILMQKPSANAGIGASLGGGVAESAFGSDTTKVLTKWTVSGIATFLLVAFALSMLNVYSNNHNKSPYGGVNIEEAIGLKPSPGQ